MSNKCIQINEDAIVAELSGNINTSGIYDDLERILAAAQCTGSIKTTRDQCMADIREQADELMNKLTVEMKLEVDDIVNYTEDSATSFGFHLGVWLAIKAMRSGGVLWPMITKYIEDNNTSST